MGLLSLSLTLKVNKFRRMMNWLGNMGPAAADAVPHLAAFMEVGCDQEHGSSREWYVYADAIRALGSIGEEAAGATPAIMCFVDKHGDWQEGTATGYDTIRKVVEQDAHRGPNDLESCALESYERIIQ
jgi:hypothetical protein